MSAVARLAVRVAVRMLPSTMRERYREQWAADLRDAAEAGIPSAEIAWGSLAFAVSVDRPVLEAAVVDDGTVLRRSRRAGGLALSAALLGLSQYASMVSFGGLVGFGLLDWALFLGSGLLTVYTAFAVVASLVLVTFTRGVSGAARLAVWLLAVASCAPLAFSLVSSGLGDIDNLYVSPATASYLLAGVLTMLAGVLLVRAHGLRAGATAHTRSVAVFGGLLVGAAVAAGVLSTVQLWSARPPLVEIEGLSPQQRAELGAAIVQHDSAVVTVFVAWAVVGAVLAIAVVALGFTRRATTGRTVSVTAAALCAALLANGAILVFVQLSMQAVEATLPVALMLLPARYGIIALCLVSVAGMRFARREPAVELAAA